MTTEAHPQYRADIDGLRAVAVLSVVGFHAFPKLLRGGFIGVDIFFVISGFLISGIIVKSLYEGRFSYADFYARRIRRIFPALVTVLAACLVFGMLFLFPNDYKDLGRQTLAGVGFLANIFFWKQSGYFNLAQTLKPLLHLWSLGIEEQFYFVWPLLIAALHKRTRRPPLIIACLLIASFICNVVGVRTDANATFYLPTTRFWELLLGALLAYVAISRKDSLVRRLLAAPTSPTARSTQRASEVLGVCGAILITTSLLYIDETMAFPGWWALMPTVGALCLIGGRHSWLNRKVLASRGAVFVGLISYPLYLWHWVLLAMVPPIGTWQGSRLVRFVLVASSFVLAWLTYELIEKPMRFGSRPALRTQALVLSAALVGVAAAGVVLTDGAVFRYPAALRELAAFHYDADRAYRMDVCQLNGDMRFERLAPKCIDPAEQDSKLIVLWGDSHASSLYQGLKAKQSELGGLRIAQFTASACPPVLDVEIGPDKAYCRRFNDAALARIDELNPDVVLLEGYWSSYFKGTDASPADLSALKRTVERLREVGAKRVVVFGDLPVWTIAQPNVALRLWQKRHVVAWRTSSYQDARAAQMDAAVGAMISRTHARFASPMKLLCNEGGCLLSTDRRVPTPLAWDYAHLTNAGSKLLIGLAWPAILSD